MGRLSKSDNWIKDCLDQGLRWGRGREHSYNPAFLGIQGFPGRSFRSVESAVLGAVDTTILPIGELRFGYPADSSLTPGRRIEDFVGQHSSSDNSGAWSGLRTQFQDHLFRNTRICGLTAQIRRFGGFLSDQPSNSVNWRVAFRPPRGFTSRLNNRRAGRPCSADDSKSGGATRTYVPTHLFGDLRAAQPFRLSQIRQLGSFRRGRP